MLPEKGGYTEMDVSIMRDGLRLYGKLEKPGEGKCPTAILFHGFTGDLGYERDSVFQLLSDRLTASGIAVARFDFNGHGKSEGNFTDMNILNEIEDAIAVLSYIRSLDFVTEIYVAGHSMGGVVAGMLAGYYPDVIKRLALMAPAATLKDDALKGVCMDAVYDTKRIPDTVCVGGTHRVGGHYFRIAKLLPIYEVTGCYEGPSLIIHGIHDAVVDVSAAKRYHECLKNSTLKLMEGIDHGFQGEEGESALDEVAGFLNAARL